ncbi:MAG TPA: hypothetical protein VGO62_11295, partial [Myxococcota bacterium]
MSGWLAGFAFLAALSWGVQSLALVDHLVAGRWLGVARPVLRALAPLGLALPVLFLPIAVDARALYPDHESLLAFLLRSTLVLAAHCIVTIAWLRSDASASRNVALGSAGLIVTFVASSVGAFDWFMARTPHWHSTIFGLVVLWSGVASAVGVVAIAEAKHAHERDRVDIATWLFAAVFFWGYLAFAELLILWIANVPREVLFYTLRFERGCIPFAIGAGALGFTVPFFALLFRRLKKSARAVVTLGVVVVVGQASAALWWIAPDLAHGPAVTDILGFA